MYGWNTFTWRETEKRVFKLQKRIYQASLRGEAGRVHGLQRLLVNSRSARFLAVRRVTQDNRGKKTAGVDGVKSLTPREVLFAILYAWAKRRHPKKSKGWIVRKYWGVTGGWRFRTPDGQKRLRRHKETHYQCYVKVAGARSPYDGDWRYWSTRLGYHPKVPPRVAKLLKRQEGKCRECGLRLRDGDIWEVDHIIPRKRGGTSGIHNLELLHRHCHNKKTAREIDRLERRV